MREVKRNLGRCDKSAWVARGFYGLSTWTLDLGLGPWTLGDSLAGGCGLTAKTSPAACPSLVWAYKQQPAPPRPPTRARPLANAIATAVHTRMYVCIIHLCLYACLTTLSMSLSAVRRRLRTSAEQAVHAAAVGSTQPAGSATNTGRT